jgi:hypothetical protein
MKTKSFLITVLIILSGILNVNSVFAQTTYDNVTLNIKLNPIQTITVNASEVNLSYTDKAHYEKGVTSGKLGSHLSIFSTGAFNVSVSAKDDVFQTDNVDSDIPVNIVKITATGGIEETGKSGVELNTNPALLIASTTGGSDLKYDVEYKTTHSEYAYINHYKDGSNNTFTTTVTYTIVPVN